MMSGCCGWFRSWLLVAAVLAFTGAFQRTERVVPEPSHPEVVVGSVESPSEPSPEPTGPPLLGYHLPEEPAPSDPRLDATSSVVPAGEEFGTDPVWDEPVRGPVERVVADWNAADRARAGLGSWERFLRTWLDPLLRESDGLGFFDPAAYQIPSVLPESRPREFGFGLRFRASF